MDCEVLQQFQRYFEPALTDTSPDALAVDAIADVGPHGHFFGADHTQSRYTQPSTRPSSATGATTRPGRRPAPPPPSSAPTASGRRSSPNTSRRRWTRPSATSSPPSSPAASARAARPPTIDKAGARGRHFAATLRGDSRHASLDFSPARRSLPSRASSPAQPPPRPLPPRRPPRSSSPRRPAPVADWTPGLVRPGHDLRLAPGHQRLAGGPRRPAAGRPRHHRRPLGARHGLHGRRRSSRRTSSASCSTPSTPSSAPTAPGCRTASRPRPRPSSASTPPPLSYRVYDDPKGFVDVYGGARYFDTSVEFKLAHHQPRQAPSPRT